MKVSKRLLSSLLTLGALSSAMAATPDAVPFPTRETPQAVDVGAVAAQSASTPISVTVALSLRNVDEAERLLQSLSTPGSAQYHQFLTADEFVARFAPTRSDVAKAIAAFAKYGLTAVQATATTLKVSGTPADMERAFSVSLHNFSVAAHGNAPGYSFRAPQGQATLPSELSELVSGVAGLSTRPALHPFHVSAQKLAAKQSAPASGSSTTISPFGSLTVTDFANLYNVTPLYKKGVTGAGRTLGIMSLAGFTPSDAYTYWSSIGLKVNPHRIQIVNVDGGPGAPSDASGSFETTLDVEQAGGVAPGANMIVYLAPNTNQAFVDIFATAIEANKVDTLSISWGQWEWFDNLQNAPVIDPRNGKTVSTTRAIHELLIRAALQGQSVITAAGDGGAYDVNHDLGCNGPFSASDPKSCSLTLSVDYPASDPAITAAGGTTLPGPQSFCLDSACTTPFVIDVPHQRVWGWDYLEPLCKALSLSFEKCGILYAGGGGGVSVTFYQPFYQWGAWGTQLSQPGQVFQAGTSYLADGIGLYYALPAYFPGRNVPDISFNADPQTGYEVAYTSDVSGFSVQQFWGGTSFVSPQINGIASLLNQYVHGRVGLLNFALYGAQYEGPVKPIAYGDNWFYKGSHSYNPGAGLGTLDVTEFAQYLRNWF
jgi:subtilase family serine protease